MSANNRRALVLFGGRPALPAALANTGVLIWLAVKMLRAPVAQEATDAA